MHFGGAIAQFDDRPNAAGGTEHHIPGEFGDFAGAQSGSDREEDNDAVTKGEAGIASEEQQVFELICRKYLGLLAWHLDIKSMSRDSSAMPRRRNGNRSLNQLIGFH